MKPAKPTNKKRETIMQALAAESNYATWDADSLLLRFMELEALCYTHDRYDAMPADERLEAIAEFGRIHNYIIQAVLDGDLILSRPDDYQPEQTQDGQTETEPPSPDDFA